jgi:hypothetical protein
MNISAEVTGVLPKPFPLTGLLAGRLAFRLHIGSMKEAKKTKKKTPPIDRPKKSHSKPASTKMHRMRA